MKKSKTVVIIPAYNEEHSIGDVLLKIQKLKNIHSVIVINDGSNDNTGNTAIKHGAIVIKQNNQGSGKAIRMGLKHVVRLKNIQSLVILDADGQHNPIYIPLLLKQLSEGNDYVIASRYLLKSDHVTSLARRIGTKFISFLFHTLYGNAITDPTSGFRAMNVKTLHYLSNHYPTTFSEPEVILDLLEKDFIVEEIPCQMNKRKYGRSSISSMKALSLMAFIFVKILYRKIKKLKSSRHPINY